MLSQSSEDIFKVFLSTDKSLWMLRKGERGIKGDWGWREGTRRRKLQRSTAAAVWQTAVLMKLLLAPDLCQELFIKPAAKTLKHKVTGNARLLGGAYMNKQHTGPNPCPVMTYLHHVTKCKNIKILFMDKAHMISVSVFIKWGFHRPQMWKTWLYGRITSDPFHLKHPPPFPHCLSVTEEKCSWNAAMKKDINSEKSFCKP